MPRSEIQGKVATPAEPAFTDAYLSHHQGIPVFIAGDGWWQYAMPVPRMLGDIRTTRGLRDITNWVCRIMHSHPVSLFDLETSELLVSK